MSKSGQCCHYIPKLFYHGYGRDMSMHIWVFLNTVHSHTDHRHGWTAPRWVYNLGNCSTVCNIVFWYCVLRGSVRESAEFSLWSNKWIGKPAQRYGCWCLCYLRCSVISCVDAMRYVCFWLQCEVVLITHVIWMRRNHMQCNYIFKHIKAFAFSIRGGIMQKKKKKKMR